MAVQQQYLVFPREGRVIEEFKDSTYVDPLTTLRRKFIFDWEILAILCTSLSLRETTRD